MDNRKILVVVNIVPERLKGVIEAGYYEVLREENGDIALSGGYILLSEEEDECWTEFHLNK